VFCMIVFKANGIGQGSRKRLRTALPRMIDKPPAVGTLTEYHQFEVTCTSPKPAEASVGFLNSDFSRSIAINTTYLTFIYKSYYKKLSLCESISSLRKLLHCPNVCYPFVRYDDAFQRLDPF
jgi:hypothetical protein